MLIRTFQDFRETETVQTSFLCNLKWIASKRLCRAEDPKAGCRVAGLGQSGFGLVRLSVFLISPDQHAVTAKAGVL